MKALTPLIEPLVKVTQKKAVPATLDHVIEQFVY